MYKDVSVTLLAYLNKENRDFFREQTHTYRIFMHTGLSIVDAIFSAVSDYKKHHSAFKYVEVISAEILDV